MEKNFDDAHERNCRKEIPRWQAAWLRRCTAGPSRWRLALLCPLMLGASALAVPPPKVPKVEVSYRERVRTLPANGTLDVEIAGAKLDLHITPKSAHAAVATGAAASAATGAAPGAVASHVASGVAATATAEGAVSIWGALRVSAATLEEARLASRFFGLSMSQQDRSLKIRLTVEPPPYAPPRPPCSAAVELHISVPTHLALRVRIREGNVFLGSVGGPVDVVVGYGAIRMQVATASELHVQTGHGTIESQLRTTPIRPLGRGAALDAVVIEPFTPSGASQPGTPSAPATATSTAPGAAVGTAVGTTTGSPRLVRLKIQRGKVHLYP